MRGKEDGTFSPNQQPQREDPFHPEMMVDDDAIKKVKASPVVTLRPDFNGRHSQEPPSTTVVPKTGRRTRLAPPPSSLRPRISLSLSLGRPPRGQTDEDWGGCGLERRSIWSHPFLDRTTSLPFFGEGATGVIPMRGDQSAYQEAAFIRA